MQAGTFLVGQKVATRSEHFIDGEQIHSFAFGQVGRFVENQAAMADMGSKGLHQPRVYPSEAPATRCRAAGYPALGRHQGEW